MLSNRQNFKPLLHNAVITASRGCRERSW